MKQRDVLELIEWGEKHFGSITTNRQLPRRDMLRCVQVGLAKSQGQVAMCDGDGGLIQPERYREGFILTGRGRSAIAAYRGKETT